MRRLWLLRYGRPLILLIIVAALAMAEGFPILAMHINMFGSNKALSEILILFATDPYVLLATAATFTALTPIGRNAVAWLSNRTTVRPTLLIVRIPFAALLVALSFSRPDDQYRLASDAAAGAVSPEASGRIIGSILGASYFWPLSVVFGVSATISGGHFWLAAGAALFTLVVSSGLAVAIIALFYQAPQAAINEPVAPTSNLDAGLCSGHELPYILFWPALITVAVMFTALPYSDYVAALALTGSIIFALCYRALKMRALLTISGTYFATALLYGALIIAGGVVSQLLTISGLLQDFAFEYQNENRAATMLIVCAIVFIFSTIFGTLATTVSLTGILVLISTMVFGVTGPWPLICTLLVLKLASTVSPLGFINNAVSVDSPAPHGYLSRLRILFPVIAADIVVFAILVTSVPILSLL